MLYVQVVSVHPLYDTYIGQQPSAICSSVSSSHWSGSMNVEVTLEI